jgi:hypothetical protein
VVPTAGQEAGQAGRGAQFGGFGALAAGDLNGLVEPCLRIAGSAPARCQQEFAAEAVDLRLPATRSVRLSGRWGSRLAAYRCGQLRHWQKRPRRIPSRPLRGPSHASDFYDAIVRSTTARHLCEVINFRF